MSLPSHSGLYRNVYPCTILTVWAIPASSLCNTSYHCATSASCCATWVSYCATHAASIKEAVKAQEQAREEYSQQEKRTHAQEQAIRQANQKMADRLADVRMYSYIGGIRYHCCTCVCVCARVSVCACVCKKACICACMCVRRIMHTDEVGHC